MQRFARSISSQSSSLLPDYIQVHLAAAPPPCSNPLLQPLNDTNSQNPPTTISTYIDQCPVPRPRSLSAGKRWPPRNPRHRYTPFFTHAERAERIEARETQNPELIKRVLLR